ncbi:MAG: hypothetical protein U0572_00360 [Phycisphaerales bacterium]
MPKLNPERLSHKQERAIVALLNEPSIQKAADSQGVHLRTLQKWLTEPSFIEAYRAARRAAFSQAIALTMRYAPLAVNTLAKIMMDANSPVTAKVAAAVAVLKFGREGIELEDLAERIAALERAAADRADASTSHMSSAA